jgi:hypothetical protein
MAWTALSKSGSGGVNVESVADESDAKLRLKAMTDYVGSQKAISCSQYLVFVVSFRRRWGVR